MTYVCSPVESGRNTMGVTINASHTGGETPLHSEGQTLTVRDSEDGTVRDSDASDGRGFAHPSQLC